MDGSYINRPKSQIVDDIISTETLSSVNDFNNSVIYNNEINDNSDFISNVNSGLLYVNNDYEDESSSMKESLKFYNGKIVSLSAEIKDLLVSLYKMSQFQKDVYKGFVYDSMLSFRNDISELINDVKSLCGNPYLQDELQIVWGNMNNLHDEYNNTACVVNESYQTHNMDPSFTLEFIQLEFTDESESNEVMEGQMVDSENQVLNVNLRDKVYQV